MPEHQQRNTARQAVNASSQSVRRAVKTLPGYLLLVCSVTVYRSDQPAAKVAECLILQQGTAGVFTSVSNEP